MLDDLKLREGYEGFVYLADATLGPTVMRRHHHVELELNLVTRGSITYVLEGRRYTFGPRTLLWFFPAQEHQLVDRTDNARYFVAVFRPSMIRAAARSPDYAELRRSRPSVSGVVQARLAPTAFELLSRAQAALCEGGPEPVVANRECGYGVASNYVYTHHDVDRLNAGLRHLLLASWKEQRLAAELGRAVELHPTVLATLGRLAEGHTEESVGELARRAGVSEEHLSRIFRRETGVPLSRYRNSVRLERFWAGRGRPGVTILEAALAAGFGSYAQFYKVFVQAYGQGPRAMFGLR
jgi:AraC-like DNA-binding protein